MSSGHWVEMSGGRQTVEDDPKQVGEFLESLGLAYRLSSFDGHATDAVIALRPEIVEEYLRASDYAAMGKLFGYPATAVEAFVANEEALLPLDEQSRCEQEAGLPDGLTTFRLSREHWSDELKVVRQWYEVLGAVGLVTE